jgi:hypothetical protein
MAPPPEEHSRELTMGEISEKNARGQPHARMMRGSSTHMPELRTWYKTLRALFHFSMLLDVRHSSRECSMRFMRSCFLPDLLSIVQHSSLNPTMICLSLSTVLSLTLTLRVCEVMIKIVRGMHKERGKHTSKSTQGSVADMTKAEDRMRRQTLLLPWMGGVWALGKYTIVNTHVTHSFTRQHVICRYSRRLR